MANSVILERLLPDPEKLTAPGTIRLNLLRIYVLPTRQGIIFSILLLAMLFGSINYNNSMAFILTFLLSSLFIVSILHTCRNLAELEISGSRPEPVFAGDTTHFPVLLNNNGRARFAIRFICYPKRKNKRSAINISFQPIFIDVKANDNQRAHIPVPTKTRGLLRLGRIMISTSFPLGLFRAWTYIDINQRCVVYPKPAGIFELPLHQMENLLGQQGLMTGTDDFAGFRAYHPGDSIRIIAWKALAQEHGLLVKRFSGHETNEVVFQFDDLAYLNTIEERISQLCRWVIEAEKKGLAYSLKLPDIEIETGIGNAHMCQCLDALAKFGLNKNE